jgi:hypothetical protein
MDRPALAQCEKGGAVAQIDIADGHIPRLQRLSDLYEIELQKLINLIVAIGVETLENPDDEPIAYELVHREDL